ncbi:hypothetical protein D3Z62_26815 [Lachnospiraceae bacterium]|nr:hypothetical protein [Lachnospiraceae bacterium]
MKRYICKKNENRDCYKEAVIEILDKMKDLENDSLILKSIDLCENALYQKLLFKTLDSLKRNKRYTAFDINNRKILMEDLNDDDTIESLLDGVNDNPIKIDHVEDISLFEEIQNEIKKLLISGKCKYNIIQGWQFLTLYDDLENNISVFLCIYDDELGLALNMERKEYDTFFKENHIEEFYDVMLYGLALIDYNKHYREFILDIWN